MSSARAGSLACLPASFDCLAANLALWHAMPVADQARQSWQLGCNSNKLFLNIHLMQCAHACFGRKKGQSSKTGPGSQAPPRILQNFGVLQEGSAEPFAW